MCIVDVLLESAQSVLVRQPGVTRVAAHAKHVAHIESLRALDVGSVLGVKATRKQVQYGLADRVVALIQSMSRIQLKVRTAL